MKITTKIITRSALILALAVAVQMLRLPQPFTGPAVNTLLFLATGIVGPISAILIGLLTPLFAFIFGIMALPPLIPVIMAGNATLAIVFALLLKRPYLGVIIAALAKFAVMAVSVQYILPVLLKITLKATLVQAFTYPQLYTALVGGAVALIILQGLKWMKNKPDLMGE